jgi:glycosyltransferase involved in cell wall biosynthesis
MANRPKYSIVIPAFNESRRITDTLDKVLAHIDNEGWDAEVIVVDDGSQDETPAILSCYAERHPAVRVLQNRSNRGKGYSVRYGMLNALGELMLLSDADLSSPIHEAPKLFATLADGAEVAIGSRWLDSELQSSCFWACATRIRSAASKHSLPGPQEAFFPRKGSNAGALTQNFFS